MSACPTLLGTFDKVGWPTWGRRVVSATIEDPASGCWLWQGNPVRGYARFSLNGRPVYVHRLMWEHVHGPIPA